MRIKSKKLKSINSLFSAFSAPLRETEFENSRNKRKISNIISRRGAENAEFFFSALDLHKMSFVRF